MQVASAATFAALTGNGLVLVKFGATWCQPCVSITPVLLSLEKSVPGLRVVTVDVDHDRPLAVSQGVRAIPAIHLLRDGNRVAEHAGIVTETDLRAKFKL